MIRHEGRGKYAHRLIVSLEDYSGTWSAPYREAGYTVMQVDLKHGSDARLIRKLNEPVHGVLCAPVCTDFSGAGAKHWAAKAAAGNKGLLDGLAIVDANIRFIFVHKPKFWVLENPVGRLKDWIGYHRHTFNPNEYAGWLGDEILGDQVIRKPEATAFRHAWWDDKPDELPLFSWMEDAYTKRTCLWGEFEIPEEKEMPAIHGSKMWSQYGGKSERTKELRSKTPPGFSRAFFASNR